MSSIRRHKEVIDDDEKAKWIEARLSFFFHDGTFRLSWQHIFPSLRQIVD